MSGQRGFQQSNSKFGEDYQRPRRPNEDTLAYIKSLPLDIQQSAQEVERFYSAASKQDNKDDDENYPQLFAAALSAIDELKTEIASLAGDEDGSQCLEILARITCPHSELAARKLLLGCSGYFLHLSTHRYGSHVVQTILQLSSTTRQTQPGDLAKWILEEDDYQQEEEGLGSLQDLLLGVVQELSPHATELAVHLCGSHVLRTLLCVLAGIELTSEKGDNTSLVADSGNLRRGRPKKKKKKKPASERPAHAGVMHMVYTKPSHLRIDVQKDEFRQALDTLVEAFLGNQGHRPGELQKLASHPSAGPLLIVLLKALTYTSCQDPTKWQEQSTADAGKQRHHLGIQPPQPKFELDSSAHKLAKKILCWPEDDDPEEQSFVGDVIYGLAGEPRGSHMLEALLHVSPLPFYESILHYGDLLNRTTLQDYIDDPVSNFVVQALLNTIPTKEQADRLLKALAPILASGSVLDPQKKRRGILWKTVELAAHHRVGQDAILKSIRLGFAALQQQQDSQKVKEEEEDDKPKKKKQRKKASTTNFTQCIHQLLNAQDDDKTERLTLDVAGARTVYFLLRFAPRLCEDTLQAIVAYPTERLLQFAKDGLASRCIWDGILEGPTDSPSFAKALQQLRDALSGQWVALSCDRVGQHVVQKMFRVSPTEERRKLVAELSHAIPRLSGSAMGRSVMETCGVREFSQGTAAWNRAVKKAALQDDWLEDVIGASGEDRHTENKKKKKARKGEKLEDGKRSKKQKTKNQ